MTADTSLGVAQPVLRGFASRNTHNMQRDASIVISDKFLYAAGAASIALAFTLAMIALLVI